MKWIDGSELDEKQYTGMTLCEKLAGEMWTGCNVEDWPKWPDCVRTAYFLLAFDTELTMEGIFTFLENSIGHYAPQIIRAFRAIGDGEDGDILEEICTLCPPDALRGELLVGDHQEYEVTHFHEDHELKEEVARRVAELGQRLYLYTDRDVWEPLFAYVDRELAKL